MGFEIENNLSHRKPKSTWTENLCLLTYQRVEMARTQVQVYLANWVIKAPQSKMTLGMLFGVLPLFFFFLHLWHTNVPGLGIKPSPQQ